MEAEKKPEAQDAPQPTPHQGGSYALSDTGDFILIERTQESGDKSCQDS